jgi:hypothetical protein
MTVLVAAKTGSYRPYRAVGGLAAESIFAEVASRGDSETIMWELGERSRSNDRVM